MSGTIEIDNSAAVVKLAPGAKADASLPALANSPPPLRRRPDAGPARLSFAQERLWFLDQINPDDVLGNLSRGVRLKGALDTEALKLASQAVVARHEILRTTFAKNEHHAGTDGQPRQLVAEAIAIDLATIDLSLTPQAEREDKARTVARAAARKPFDLALGPLLRLGLVKLDESDHILLLHTHRIVADELSLDIFFRELWACYRALLTHEDPRLEAMPVQFADYANWQREWLQGEVLKQQLDYWQATLAGAPPVMELPTDRPRPSVQTSHGSSCSLLVEQELTERLRATSAGGEATLFDAMLAAFQIVLSRYTRQTDIVIGTTPANRDAKESRALIGPLNSALVLRTDLANNPSFRELVARTSDTTGRARAHRAMPFARLLEELPIERSLSHAPVFQILFDYNSESDDTAGSDASAPLHLEPFDFESGISPYDLTLNLVETANQIRCRLEYNTDLFERATIVRLLGHYEQVLVGVAADPQQSIDELEILTANERDQILHEWNDTERLVPAQSVVQMFEAQVERTPGSVAAFFNGEELSYRELNDHANQLARYLQTRGIGPDARVGICLERGLGMAVSVLATLKAGGAYVPLDPGYPQERLRFMLEDSHCSVLLTSEDIAQSLPETNTLVVHLDRAAETIASEGKANLGSRSAPENLAYVIYTSGSTGWPKGVAMTHRALTNVISWQLENSTGPATTLQFASLSFDVSFQELFTTWCSGGTLLLVADELRRDAPALLRYLVDQKVARIFLPFVYLQHLAEAADLCGVVPEALREIITAGEQLEITPQIAQLCNRLPACRLYNHYGPSETHVVTSCALDGAPEQWPTLPPIGRPIANTQVYLVDRNLKLLPIGVPGELCIGGDNVSRGYLNRPEVTSEKFVPDPFGQSAGARLYRTGDLARTLRDGNIEFLGRLDHQVKIRGFRIEPGEIEALLRTHPAVRDAVVRPKESNDGLVAFVVVDHGQLHSQETIGGELRKHLASKLPDYMAPSIFVELEALPLTPSGKVNRRALSVPDAYRPESGQEHVAPRNDVEATLVKLWQKVLGLKSIGVKDNFFELGGHSLLASRLFAQIQNTFGRNLPLATLFQSPTVEQLAVVLREHELPDSWSSLVAIQPKGSRPPLFCVHAAGANVLIYRPLARHLGLDQPVYALQARGLDGRTAPLVRVADMAAHYIREMRCRQPEGPYLLLGASFGGLVIFEMAQQLIEQGQQVALLAMLNTDCPVYSFAKRIRCHAGNLIKKGPKAYLAFVVRSVLRRVSPRAEEKIAETLAGNEELQAAIESRPDSNDPLIRTVLANLQAEHDYTPSRKTYPGKITYFWARAAAVDFQDNRAAWRRLAAGGIEMHVVPGDHGTMREEPNIAVLVEKLKPILHAA